MKPQNTTQVTDMATIGQNNVMDVIGYVDGNGAPYPWNPLEPFNRFEADPTIKVYLRSQLEQFKAVIKQYKATAGRNRRIPDRWDLGEGPVLPQGQVPDPVPPEPVTAGDTGRVAPPPMPSKAKGR